MSAPHALIRHAAFAGLSALVFGIANAMAASLPARVTFASADGRTTLVGYVFLPEEPHAARVPAVVMMHGRAGAYSSLANGKYDAATLSKRHQQWGQIWAAAGLSSPFWSTASVRAATQTAFRATATSAGPEELNEVTVRPLDAYGALAYLRTRGDVLADRIGLQGWSNGGSATLATMSETAPASRSQRLPPASGQGWRSIRPAA